MGWVLIQRLPFPSLACLPCLVYQLCPALMSGYRGWPRNLLPDWKWTPGRDLYGDSQAPFNCTQVRLNFKPSVSPALDYNDQTWC